jgi:hypothetical protein
VTTRTALTVGQLYHVMPYLSCHILSSDVTSCHILSCDITSRDVCLSAVLLTRSAGPSRDSSHRFSMFPNSFEERKYERIRKGLDVASGTKSFDDS